MKSFGEITRDKLIERGTVTAIGNANWASFVNELDGVSYETLRKGVTGERQPSLKLMQAVADALGVDPNVFYEYRLESARQSFDPTVVGEEAALANLEKWSATEKRKSQPHSRRSTAPA